MSNPANYVGTTDAPFNFGMTCKDWDRLYHDQRFPDELKPKEDPCSWSELQKAEVDANALQEIADYLAWCRQRAYIGQRVTKRSGKPFKSGAKANTVVRIDKNPHTGHAAFGFEEDDSLVDCQVCLDQLGQPIATINTRKSP